MARQALPLPASRPAPVTLQVVVHLVRSRPLLRGPQAVPVAASLPGADVIAEARARVVPHLLQDALSCRRQIPNARRRRDGKGPPVLALHPRHDQQQQGEETPAADQEHRSSKLDHGARTLRKSKARGWRRCDHVLV
eukprot:753169-Hanusia_phi.AAC.3